MDIAIQLAPKTKVPGESYHKYQPKCATTPQHNARQVYFEAAGFNRGSCDSSSTCLPSHMTLQALLGSKPPPRPKGLVSEHPEGQLHPNKIWEIDYRVILKPLYISVISLLNVFSCG